MTTAEIVEEIRQRAKLLPEAERHSLALELLGEATTLEELGMHPDWGTELARRAADAASGKTKFHSHAEASALVRARFGW